MCLAIVGKITLLDKHNMALVNIAGNYKEINIALCPEARIGEYVLIHAGFAIEKIEETQALAVQSVWEEIERYGL